MSTNVLQVRIQQGYDTEDGWAESDPVLLEGEFAINSDTYDYKVGDGTSTWSELPYASGQLTFAASQIYDLESAISAMDLIVSTAQYLGTDSVGANNKWMYLEGGAPVACTATIGSESQPVYINSGVVTALPSTIGSSTKPIYVSNGSLTASSASVGSSSSPIYIDSGTLKECVTVNATTVSVSDISPSAETTYYLTSTVEPGNVSLLSNDGLKFAVLTGTASALGYNRINLGTNIASGTTKNAYGILRIYSTGTGYWDITGNKSSSDSFTLMLPSSDGCLITAVDGVAIGGTTVPVYVKSDGSVAECTSISLNAATATKLAASVTIRTNLASTSTASFDGSASVTPGVTGTLAVGNGGTGNTTGTATYATTTEDIANTLYPVGVTSTATTALKRDTSITMVGGTITATSFVGSLSGSATSLATSRTLQTNLASTASASFNGTANATIGVTGILGISNGGTGTETGHISITKSTDTTSTASPALGSTFSVIDAITRDSYGHITKVNTTTITLPTVESASDTKVTQTLTSTSSSYPVLLAPTGQTTTATTTAYFGTGLQFNPNTNTLTTTTFSGALSGNASTATKWQTARTITIGSTGKSVDGSAAVSWTLSEIGAAASSHTHSYAASSSAGGAATYATTTSDTSGALYLVGVTSDATTTLKRNTSITMTGGALVATTYNGYTLAAACAKAVTDSSSASAISTSTSLTTERDVYYGLPTINGSHTYTSGTTIYAPTSAGTSGQVLTSNGSGAPSWSTISTGSSSTTISTSTSNIYITGVTSSTTASTSTLYRTSSTDVYISGTTIYATTFSGALSGNATTATTLATPRTINGTSFNGSANITTANWGTSRTITIGSTGKSVDGSAAVSWTLSEIGAASSSHTHSYAASSSAGGSATTVAFTATNPTSQTWYYLPFTSSSSPGALLYNDGFYTSTLQGTSSAVGFAYLRLGNGTASGTAGNKYGSIALYGTSTAYWHISGQKALTTSRILYLPDPGSSTGGCLTCVPTDGTAVGSDSLPVYVNTSGVVTQVTTLTAQNYDGTYRRTIGSGATDGQRVSAIQSKSTGLGIYGQYGTTGSTYTGYTFLFDSSDIRLKDNVEDCTISALPVIREIIMRQFDWNNRTADVHQDIGMVADELELIDPHFAVGGGYDEEGNMDVKCVNTFYMMGYAIKGIQELDSSVQTHEEQIAELQAQVADLQSQIAQLQASA